MALPGKEVLALKAAWKPMRARWGGTTRQKPSGSQGRSVGLGRPRRGRAESTSQ